MSLSPRPCTGAIHLPPEMLGRIMSYAMPPFNIDPWSYDDALCSVRSVCRQWLQAADGEHILWTKILVDQNTPVGFIPSRLSKAGSLPLHVHIHVINCPYRTSARRHAAALAAWFSAFNDEMLPFVARWCTATIHSPTQELSTVLIAALAVLEPTALATMNLDMEFAGRLWSTPRSPLPLHFALQHLSCLSFRHGFSTWRSPTSYLALRCLHLANMSCARFLLTWDSLEPLLTTPLNLTHLSLLHVDVADVDYIKPPPSVVLPHLTHLRLAARSTASLNIMLALRFPSIREVHLNIEGALEMAFLCHGSPHLLSNLERLGVHPDMHYRCRRQLEEIPVVE
ncbi:hypothetical protein C8J57DRAFT_1535541 [Mycena rebaudengoi]|nr:hypothetical protein C8J57DRAFT_1535541 [Mycena rebaudengoi]